MDTDIAYVSVNGNMLTPGCMVDSHHGQYVPDVLASLAQLLGWQPREWHYDPRLIRKVCDFMLSLNKMETPASLQLWEFHAESADDILGWLNSHTESAEYYWDWYEGNIMLQPLDNEGCGQWGCVTCYPGEDEAWYDPEWELDDADADAYLAYTSACINEELDFHTPHMWRVHGRPTGPLG